MLPYFSSNNQANEWPAYPKKCGKSLLVSAFGAVRSYEQNLFFCQLGHFMLRAARQSFRVFYRAVPVSESTIGSALGISVSGVIGQSSNKKVTGVYARRIVAFVKHALAFFNSTVGDCPRKPVTRHFIFGVYPKKAIAVSASGCYASTNITLPHPALSKVWSVRLYRSIFVNLVPKSFQVSITGVDWLAGTLNTLFSNRHRYGVLIVRKCRLLIQAVFSFINPQPGTA